MPSKAIAARLPAEPGWRAAIMIMVEKGGEGEDEDQVKLALLEVNEWTLHANVAPAPPRDTKIIALEQRLAALASDDHEKRLAILEDVKALEEKSILPDKPFLWPCFKDADGDVHSMIEDESKAKLIGCYPPDDKRSDQELLAALSEWFDALTKIHEQVQSGKPPTAWDKILSG